MITIQHTEEQLSLAYVHALAGVAGVNVAAQRSHDYGVDGTFCPVVYLRGRRTESGFHIDFQMKATVNWRLDEDYVVYSLEAKTYNDLIYRSTAATPLVLILLCLTSNQADWLFVDEQQLLLKHCAYWFRPEGEPTENPYSKTVRIPRSQLLTADNLNGLLAAERARMGG